MIIPILIEGFGNRVVPFMIGAPDMAFFKMNKISIGFFLSSVILLLASILNMGNSSLMEFLFYSSFFFLYLSNFLNCFTISYMVFFLKNYMFSLNTFVLFLYFFSILTTICLLVLISLFIDYTYILATMILVRIIVLTNIYFREIVSRQHTYLNTYRNSLVFIIILYYLFKKEFFYFSFYSYVDNNFEVIKLVSLRKY